MSLTAHQQPEMKKARQSNEIDHLALEIDGRGGKTIYEPNAGCGHLSIFINHFLSKPSENAAFLRVIFVEKQLSAAQISKETGWPKTSVIEALQLHGITREPKVRVQARYGWKVEDGQLVPHARQQLVVQKMKRLRDSEGWSFNRIAQHLNLHEAPATRH